MNGLVRIQIDEEVCRGWTLLFRGAASANEGVCGGYSLGFERGLRLMKGNRAQVEKETRCEPVEIFTQHWQLDPRNRAYVDSKPHSA